MRPTWTQSWSPLQFQNRRGPRTVFPNNTVICFDRTEVDLVGLEYEIMPEEGGIKWLRLTNKSTFEVAQRLGFGSPCVEVTDGKLHAVMNEFDFEFSAFNPLAKEAI